MYTLSIKSIRKKLLIVMLGLVISVQVVATLFQINTQENLLNEELEHRSSLMKFNLLEKAKSLKENLARQVEDSIASYDFYNLTEEITRVVLEETDLEYVILMNNEGFALVHTENELAQEETILDNSDLMALATTSSTQREYKRNGIEILEYIEPINSGAERWGILRIGFSMQALNAEITASTTKINGMIQNAFANSLIISFFVILVGGIIVSIVSKRISDPIVLLTKSAQALSSGDYDISHIHKFNTQNEIGMLSRTFIEMAENIRKTHAELEENSENLEQKVTERTYQLEEALKEISSNNIELIDAREKAIEASQEKSNFLANMSHELRTPLNAIIGYSEILQEDMVDNKGASVDLDRIHRSGNHLLSLIGNILDLSKIEAGRMDVYVEQFSISELIHEVTSTMGPLVAKKNNALYLKIPDDAGAMISDELKVKQTLLNLLGNAAKFTRNGNITLDVSMQEDRNGQWVLFEISDTGIGMSAKQIKKLFRPFSQADSSTTRQYGGTGLGLTICKHFCNLLGGDVSIKSVADQGTSFTVRLPRIYIEKNQIDTIPAKVANG